MASGINVGRIEADLDVNSGNMIRGLESARSALTAFMAEMKKLDSEVQHGAIDAATYNARVSDLQSIVSRLTPQMQAAHAAVQANGSALNLVNASAVQGRAAFGGLGMAMMQVGYIADDLQYGFKAIVNNLAPLGQTAAGTLGATAAQANMAGAALQIAGVAAYQLYTHWDQLKEAMGSPVFRTAIEEMEELGKKTKKTADETARLEEYERSRASAKHRTESDTAVEKTEKEINKAIGEAGGQGVKQNVELSLLESGAGKLTNKEEALIREKTRGMFGPLVATVIGKDLHEEEEKALAEARKAKLDKATQDVMGGKSHSERAALRKIVDEHPERFEPGFLKELEDAEPTAMKQQAKWEAEGKLNDHNRVKKMAKEKADHIKEERERNEESAREREFRKENVEVAKSVLPGFEKRAEDSAARFAGQGYSREAAIGHATKALMAGEGGRSMTEKDAYQAAKDTVGKEFDKFKNDPDKLKAHDKTMHRELAQRAEEALPGLKDRAVTLTAQDRLSKKGPSKADLLSQQLQASGMTPDQADKFAKEQIGDEGKKSPKELIEAALKAQGFSANDAAMAAEDAAKGGEHDLDKKVEHGMLHKKQQATEISTLAEMRDKIQSNVSDESTKQTGLQEKMVDKLTKLAEKEQNYVAITVS